MITRPVWYNHQHTLVVQTTEGNLYLGSENELEGILVPSTQGVPIAVVSGLLAVGSLVPSVPWIFVVTEITFRFFFEFFALAWSLHLYNKFWVG